MSIDGTKLLFEGFLQKRRDTLVSYKLISVFNVNMFFFFKKTNILFPASRK